MCQRLLQRQAGFKGLENRKNLLLLGKVSGKVILDFGCWTSEGSTILRNRGADVVCVDIARYAIDTCHKKGFRCAHGYFVKFQKQKEAIAPYDQSTYKQSTYRR